jgi:hypothetical protein
MRLPLSFTQTLHAKEAERWRDAENDAGSHLPRSKPVLAGKRPSGARVAAVVDAVRAKKA